VRVVELAAGLETVGALIDAINNSPGMPDTIEARINDTGDGIVIVDTSGGDNVLTIEDVDGRAAEQLRLAGSARTGENFIDGSLEVRIEIGAGDTLDAIVGKLNRAGGDFSASILNDGGAVNPYSLTITSARSGRAGELVIDTGGIDLGLSTLTKAQDAVITIGDSNSANPALITSPSNTLDSVIEGVTLDLQSAADEAVTITVEQDVDQIVDAVNDFVDRYNEVQSTIANATSFDQETYERGTLFGDRTVTQVQNRLRQVILQPFESASESVSRMFSVGIRLGSGGQLEFDEETFREVYAESPEAVEQLFTAEDTGFGAVFEDALDALTRDADGLIDQKNELLADQQDLLNSRIDALNKLLDTKRARLEAQFVGLERSLANLQSQQDALAALSQLTAGLSF
jgi:flagellar hook-associated protein 2